MRLWVGALIVTVLAVVAVAIASEGTRRLLFDPSNQIYEGTAFEVTIGEDRDVMIATLDRQFRHLRTDVGGTCGARTYSEEYLIDRFEDRSWRSARMCVATLNGRVVTVRWFYQLVAL